MELNLDKLDSLAGTGSNTGRVSKNAEYDSASGSQKPAEGNIEGLKALQIQADQNKADRERYAEACRRYQENIHKTEILQAEILKGVKAGEDQQTLFLKAVKAISLMVNNDLFYNQIADSYSKNHT